MATSLDNLKNFAVDLASTIDRLHRAESRVSHLERIIRQAVMTHGGMLVIDANFGDAALSSSAELWIGDKGIELYENGSLIKDRG